MRSGLQYITALDDDRCAYLGGERVNNVPAHPAFASVVRTIASLYDLALDPANDMIYSPPDGDGAERANKVFMIPRSIEDLKARRLASTRWAHATHGFIG